MNDSKSDTALNAFLTLGDNLIAASEARTKKIVQRIRHETETNEAFFRLMENLTYSDEVFRAATVDALAARTNVDYYEMIATLKLLDSIELGEFIVGRKGRDSRIEWLYSSKSIGEIALGKSDTLRSIPKTSLDIDTYTIATATKRLSYDLRKDFSLELELPADFNRADFKRLTKWLDTIPFD